MKNFKFVTLALALLFNLHTSAQNFKISGTVSGLVDGTWLYLRTAAPEQMLDSAQISSGKFSLRGKTAEKVSKMIIYTSKYKNYVSFWAEKNTTLALQSGNFKHAVITGSKTQAESERLSKMQLPLQKAEDSLNNLYEDEKNELVRKALLKKIKEKKAAVLEMDLNYVKNNPDSWIAAYILDVYASVWGKEKANVLYRQLSPKMKESAYGKNIHQFIRLNKNIKQGDHFEDFEQANTNGRNIRLSDIKGKYILLEFWASWCGPCREDNPELVSIYEQFKDKGFAILGVSADDNKASWLQAIKADKLNWENVSDLKGDKNEVALIYGINAYPTNFLIDEQGIIIAKNLRGGALKEKLEALLMQKKEL